MFQAIRTSDTVVLCSMKVKDKDTFWVDMYESSLL